MLDALQAMIDPIAFEIPIGEGFPIYWYGILIATGIGLGSWWAGREIERRGEDPDELFNGLLLVVVAGYLFARLGYVLQDALVVGREYDSFLEVINIRAGGVNILWGFIGATAVGVLFTRWRNLESWHYADVAGPTLLLAQGIGRWGNFINQELYGPPTELPWGIRIEPAYRISPYNDLAAYPADTRFHPTFLYESVALLIGFGLLVYLNNRYRDEWKPGTIFGAFLIWWGGNRAWIELFRTDQPNIGETPLTYSMLLAIGVALGGVYLLLSRYDKLPKAMTLKSSSAGKKRVRKPKRRRKKRK